MKVGTKSVLFGAHCFFIHPFFVAFAWWKLYGFPVDPRLWLSFFLHDLGYWGKPNMDGEKGERHPEFAAKIMNFFFGKKWGIFCLFHSRFYAKKINGQYSKLCVADKLSICLEPWWFYLPRVILSGEIDEYLAQTQTKCKDQGLTDKSKRAWFKSVCKYLDNWVDEHKNIKLDTWTKI